MIIEFKNDSLNLTNSNQTIWTWQFRSRNSQKNPLSVFFFQKPPGIQNTERHVYPPTHARRRTDCCKRIVASKDSFSQKVLSLSIDDGFSISRLRLSTFKFSPKTSLFLNTASSQLITLRLVETDSQSGIISEFCSSAFSLSLNDKFWSIGRLESPTVSMQKATSNSHSLVYHPKSD